MEQQKSQRPQGPDNKILRFSGMAFQMGATIGLAVWAGIKLDEKTQNKHNIWTLVLSMAGVGIAIYRIIKDLSRL
jgi:ATP synthase protein I